jgi:hypothetical protein
MFEPGYYKTNHRAVRLREFVRWHGARGGFRAWVKSRFARSPSSGMWMPGLWTENECNAEALSADFWQATKPHRADFEKLGFVQCRLAKVERSLDPMNRDSGSIFYLDPTRCYFGQLIYSRRYLRASGREFNHIVIAFTAALERGSFACTNSRLSFDSANDGEVIRLHSYDVPVIYKIFQAKLQERRETPQPFLNLEALRQWFDERQIRNFEEHVRRRLFIPMTESEIAAAKADMERASKGLPPQPSRRRLRLELMPTTLVLVLLVTLMVLRHRHMPAIAGGNTIAGDTIIYQGQQFKMSRSYAEYDDYKDDPNNLDTNDLGRIERTMELVKIPASFKGSDDFIHFIFDLKFPGYGVGGIGASIQTDDGSTFDAESVEIPQMDKERVLVVRQEPGGDLKLVDDFVCEESGTNSIGRVRLEHRQLEYFDQRGKIFRKKAI